MKVVIGYPPFDSPKGRAFLAQNRQFQWGTSPWTAYPMVPAYAATMLEEAGYDVYWLDGIWGMQTYAEWEKELFEIDPDLLVLETKTPVVKLHWEIINRLKKLTCSERPVLFGRTGLSSAGLSDCRTAKLINNRLKKLSRAKERPLGFKDSNPKGRGIGADGNAELTIVLVGDHVTALPEESMENCAVDYILTGGDYDFLLLNLCNHLTKGEGPESGIWYRKYGGEFPRARLLELGSEGGLEPSSETSEPSSFPSSPSRVTGYASTGHFILNHNLDSLPFIDRDLTQWKLYAYKNSNYARTPGTYTMFGRDCYWGRCSFCSWTTLYPGRSYRQMSVKRALDEVGYILDNYPIKEIMDDSGTFPVGDWLREFCRGMIARGYHKRVRISCNMRFNSGLTREDYQLMGESGFRFLLYGLESVNQKTLDRINKNLKVEQIEPVLKWAKKAGLNPHPTAMIGYPWETRTDAQKTLNFAHRMFKEGWADTLQATIITPYPGTPLFAEAKEKGWLKTLDWNHYDMREPILKTEMSNEEIKGLVQGLYKSILTPRFILRKLKEALTDWDLFRYYLRMALKFFSKLLDFR